MEKPLTKNIPSNGDEPLDLQSLRERPAATKSLRKALRMAPAEITDLVDEIQSERPRRCWISDGHEMELRPHG